MALARSRRNQAASRPGPSPPEARLTGAGQERATAKTPARTAQAPRPTSPTAYASPMIKTGDKAPDFELPDHDGNPVRLSGLRGRPVVLYFYPKAGTRGRISLCLPPRSAER